MHYLTNKNGHHIETVGQKCDNTCMGLLKKVIMSVKRIKLFKIVMQPITEHVDLKWNDPIIVIPSNRLP